MTRRGSMRGVPANAVVDGRIVASGRWDPLPESDGAEVALSVEEGYEDAAPVIALLRELADSASRQGVRRFVHQSHPNQAGVRRLLREAGFEAATVYQEGVLRSSFAITSETPRAPGPSERRAS